MNKSESIIELSKALAVFQGEVTNPLNSKKVSAGKSFSYTYAPLDEILNIVRPLLSKNGLSIVQAPVMEDGMVGASTMLLHSSGEWMEFSPILLKLDKQTAQGAGSAITYSRRYAISSILGIASEDDDDAGSIEPEKITPQKQTSTPQGTSNGALSDNQIKRLYAIAGSKGIDAKSVKEYIKSKLNKDVKDLDKKEYDALCNGYDNMKS